MQAIVFDRFIPAQKRNRILGPKKTVFRSLHIDSKIQSSVEAEYQLIGSNADRQFNIHALLQIFSFKYNNNLLFHG